MDLFNSIGIEQTFDFVVCNPPFYSDEEELGGQGKQIRNPRKRSKGKSINTALEHESIFDKGGEVGFVKKMIDESGQLGKRVK